MQVYVGSVGTVGNFSDTCRTDTSDTSVEVYSEPVCCSSTIAPLLDTSSSLKLYAYMYHIIVVSKDATQTNGSATFGILDGEEM